MRALSVADLTDADGAQGGPLPMSAFGTKRSYACAVHLSALWADIVWIAVRLALRVHFSDADVADVARLARPV